MIFVPAKNCVLCNGRRSIVKKVDRTEVEYKCPCAESVKWWARLSDFTLPAEVMERQTFKNFDRQREPNLYASVNVWVNLVKEKKTDWIAIHGENGTGKTHIAIAAFNELLAKNIPAVLVSSAMMYDRLEHALFSKGLDHAPAERLLIECPVLGFDDIGARKLDERVAATMFRIIDGRSMAQRPTLLTADRAFSEIEDIPGWKRIVDRMLEHGLVTKTKGTSYRFEMAQKRAKELKQAIAAGTIATM